MRANVPREPFYSSDFGASAFGLEQNETNRIMNAASQNTALRIFTTKMNVDSLKSLLIPE